MYRLKKMKKSALFLFALLILISFTSAKDLYVDQNSVNGACSNSYTRIQNDFTHPWCNVSTANSLHIGGDTVYILPGKYHDSIAPKAGINNTLRTTYSGLGDKSQIIFKGSDPVTGWTQCTSGCPSINIYYTTFTSSISRSECYNEFDPPSEPVYSTFACGWDPDSTGSHRCNQALSTDCWQDETTWLIRSDLIDSRHYFSLGLSGLNSPGEFYYDYENNRLYIWATDSQNPSSHVIECSTRSVALSIDNSNINIQNITIMHSFHDGINYRGSNFTIQNNEIMYNSGQGSCAENPAAIIHHKTSQISQGDDVLRNSIHDQGSDRGPGLTNGGSHSGAGIEFYSVKDSVIEGNEVYKTQDLIHLKSGWDPLMYNNITIRNNVIHDGSVGILLSQAGSGTIYVGTFGGNLIYDIGGWGVLTNYENNNTQIYGNTIVNSYGIKIGANDNSGSTSSIYNNIITNIKQYGDPTAFIAYYWGSYEHSAMDYNVFYNTTTFFGILDTDGTSWSTNDPTWTRYNNLASWQTGSGKDLNSIETNPLFVSPSTGDFHLQANSPAIDNGTIIPGYHCPQSDDINPNQVNCRHWSGLAPDIGAFEYTSGTASKSPDVNRDGKVNVVDLAIVIFNQGRDPANQNYNHLDLDSDNRINVNDIRIVMNYI